MPILEEHKQHLNLRQTGLEDTSSSPELEGKLDEARRALEALHHQKQAMEEQRQIEEALNRKRAEFLNGQLELTEKFSSVITLIDRETVNSKQEMEELQQARESFLKHLERIEALDPSNWSEAKMDEHLDQALTTLDRADDEYEQASNYFSESRRAGVFMGGTRPLRQGQSFRNTVMEGFAFHLPLLVLGTIALLIYITK